MLLDTLGAFTQAQDWEQGQRPIVWASNAYLMEQTGFSPRETCLIGDRVYTDIACGVNAGIDTIFVLSGEGVMEDIEKYGVQPTYCMQNIREVLNTLEKGEPK